MNWQLIFREDTWGHMTGAFFVTYWLIRWFRGRMYAAVARSFVLTIMISGCVFLEFVQADLHPEWFTWADTIKDMVMNAVGITLAVVAIRGGR